MSEDAGKPGGIGVFGGTFNPIHRGHVHAALGVCDALGLERVVLVPTAIQPLKRGGGAIMAPAADRLAWAELAAAAHPQLSVDAVEVEREGASYTVDTVRILAERFGEPPVFVIGQDAFVDLPAWREPERLLTLCHLAVLPRPPVGEGSVAEWLPEALARDYEFSADGHVAHHRRAGTWIRTVPVDALDISATEVRRRIAVGESIRDLVPEAVAEAVEASGIYTMKTGNEPVTTAPQISPRDSALCDAVLELKAENVVALDVHELSAFADTFVIATGTSDRHVRAIADKVVETAKRGTEKVLGVEGYDEGRWVLIDLNDAIVHVFRREEREHYDLDRLWEDAPVLFESDDRGASAEEMPA